MTRKRPDVTVKGSEFLLDFQKQPGVMPGREYFEAISDNAGIK
jgi:hypothetical protein